MRRIWNFITSHYLCVFTGLAFIAAGLILSLRLSGDGAYFERIDHGILLSWMTDKLGAPLTFSFFAFTLIVLVTGLLFLNALLCTVRKVYYLVLEGAGWRRYLPHVMHISFLIVVSGHLVSSVSGNRVRAIPVFEGGYARVVGTPYTLKVNGMNLQYSDRGYPVELSADITLFKGTEPVSGKAVRVNHPLLHEGYGIYIKNAGMDRLGRRYAFFDANRDDGAKVVLAGAILFTVANALYLFPRRKKVTGEENETPWRG